MNSMTNNPPSNLSTPASMRYSVGTSSLGQILAAVSESGIAAILLGDSPNALLGQLRRAFPQQSPQKDDQGLAEVLKAVVRLAEDPNYRVNLSLDLQGTVFQKNVWEALKGIPVGQTATYKEIAVKTGGSAQEVGEACGANKIALIIPCHRVVRSDGSLAGYRWGVSRKRALLQKEQEAAPEPGSLFHAAAESHALNEYSCPPRER